MAIVGYEDGCVWRCFCMAMVLYGMDLYGNSVFSRTDLSYLDRALNSVFNDSDLSQNG